ncbi:MAG: T9SS type A sorting domain-containing protein [Saprospiraceae bacterium]|nr:T9SS type A sorting domain-containing protein [Saprospiraceae bacterium]
MTSTNCYYANPFNSDALAFAQHPLCGDGSITAQVTGITGTSFGWAGLVLRENNSAGAKKIQLRTNRNSNLSRREARYATNAQAYPQQSSALNRLWLRLVRQGNQFSGFTSPNGIQWTLVMAATINMTNCVEMGLVATNYQLNSTVTATFANVSTTGNNASISAPNGTMEIIAAMPDFSKPQFHVFPNPATNQISVDLSTFGDQKVVLEIRDAQGILLKSKAVNSSDSSLESFDVSGYPRGIYFIRSHSENAVGFIRRVGLQ